jgi:uncharacterized protein YukE
MADWEDAPVKNKPSTGGWEDAPAPKEPTLGQQAYAGVYGLTKGVLGGPGELEEFAAYTVPEYFGARKKGERDKFAGRETIFPTMKEVEKGAEYIGIPKPAPGTKTAEFVGEVAPAVVAGGKLLTEGLKAGFSYLPKITTKGRAEKSAVELGEQLKGAETEASKLAKERGTRQEVALREAGKQFETKANVAKEESKTALNNIAKPTNEFQVGEGLREVGKINEKQLAASANRAAEVLKTKYFNEGKTKQKAGEYWSQSKTGQEFLKYLQNVMSPVNRGKYSDGEIAAAQDINKMLQSIKYKGQVIRPEIEKIETVIRDVKKLPSKPAMTGAEAMKQQYMGKFAQKLEDSVYGYVDEAGETIEGFAPAGRTFREVYKKMMQPLNAYESQVGQILTNQIQGLKGIFTSDASQIPAKVFQSPEQVRILERMDISKKTLEPFAKQHTSNELSKLNTAEQVKEWIGSTKGSYLKEFPQLEAKVNKYAETFAKNEAEVAKRETGVKAIEAKRGVVSKTQEQAQKDISETIANIQGLQKFSPKTIGNEAIKIVSDLSSKRLITPEKAAQLEKQIAEVDMAYQGAEKLKKIRNVLLFSGLGYSGFQGAKLVIGQ